MYVCIYVCMYKANIKVIWKFSKLSCCCCCKGLITRLEDKVISMRKIFCITMGTFRSINK